MADYLAHSARHGRPTQTYQEHIRNVTKGALTKARRMLTHYDSDEGKPTRREILEIIGDASSLHDFGKLDDGFQQTLRNNRRSPNHIRHEDAGVVMLAKHGAMEAAGLVSAHHQGLVKYELERERPKLGQKPSKKIGLDPFRMLSHPATLEATRQHFDEYAKRHESLFGTRKSEQGNGLSNCTGFMRRILLSCLVDADHYDTARHYGNENEPPVPSTRWLERLTALDHYVAGLKKTVHQKPEEAIQLRQEIRDELYSACRDADTAHRLRSCDAVVGSGKTTAIMAHLLKVAAERKLRHIFVVLPYTNIINQSVEVYRNALCLPGENPEDIIAEHHHQAVFKDLDNRHLTTLWRSPIIVTTAVQFFETLGNNQTGMLRKLHELPGSAVFLDEAHASLPAVLWPVCWNWLMEWVKQWNGHLVLGSGSLAEFWQLPEFRSIVENKEPGKVAVKPVADVRSLADKLIEKSQRAEHIRIRFISEPKLLTGDELIDRVEQEHGPRLVIVNTVQSAAILAHMMKERDTQRVVHLSTALAPIHRAIIIDRIKELLKYSKNWTLVATSIVEAGLNFSFTNGFRQRCSAASLIQTGGRVNRNADKGNNCTVWDFDFIPDTDNFPNNPSIAASKRALGELFNAGRFAPETPADLSRICLEAMKMEFKPGQQIKALEPVKEEIQMNYPKVGDLCRVIQTDTRMVIIDHDLVEKLSPWKRISHNDLIQRSVQIYHSKIMKLGLTPVINGSEELYALPESWEYDPDCYGYMAEYIRTKEATIPSGFII